MLGFNPLSTTPLSEESRHQAVAGGAINATFGVTIDNFTVAATATVTISATAAQTIAAFTLAATGTVKISASFAQTIADFTQVASATLPIDAEAAQTIENFTLAATATLVTDIDATFGVTIDDFTLAASAALTISATFGQAIDEFTLAALATIEQPATTSRAREVDGSFIRPTGQALRAIYERQFQGLEDLIAKAPKSKERPEKVKKLAKKVREVALSTPNPVFEEFQRGALPAVEQYAARQIDWNTLQQIIEQQMEQARREQRRLRNRNIALSMLMAA